MPSGLQRVGRLSPATTASLALATLAASTSSTLAIPFHLSLRRQGHFLHLAVRALGEHEFHVSLGGIDSHKSHLDSIANSNDLTTATSNDACEPGHFLPSIAMLPAHVIPTNMTRH
jgi:hypothetical protein